MTSPAHRPAKAVTTLAAGLLALGALAPAPLAAQDVPPLRLELNRLEPQGENCRAYVLIDNAKRPVAYSSLKLDLFALDADGVAARRVAIELAPLAANKTAIKLFDFPGLACARFGRVLLNDILSCEGPGAKPGDCLEGVELSSKTVPFIR